jgi:hypothetical protein
VARAQQPNNTKTNTGKNARATHGLRLDQGADFGDEVCHGLRALIGVFAMADGYLTVLLFAVAYYQHVGDLL